MKAYFSAVLTALVLVHESYAILQLNTTIPAHWGEQLRHNNYVKDKDNCKFGYQLNAANLVINVFNCSRDDPTVFWVLQIKACARESDSTLGETCGNTPDMYGDDIREDDAVNCAADKIFKGVAVHPTDCTKYFFCNIGERIGRRMCPKGQYFDGGKCDYVWREVNGVITMREEGEMCGPTRKLPTGRQHDVGKISTKCREIWATRNLSWGSVAEPGSCEYSFVCAYYNPSSPSTSVVNKCKVAKTYWSDEIQKCVPAAQLTQKEFQACALVA